jgi:hypothetical protein
MEPANPLDSLRSALQERTDIIANHTWRDADPAAHLEALKTISESIFAMQKEFVHTYPPRLRHFMESQSYQKALAFLQSES